MKKIVSLLLFLILSYTLCGCNRSEEISRLAFVMSVGYDVDSYTFQIVNPSAFSGEGGESSSIISKTVFASDIYTAMDKLNSAMSEKCDFSHIKTVVFSEEKLKAGVFDEIQAMYSSNTFHPNIRVAMCTGTTQQYMKNFKIPLDANPAEFYENIFNENSNPYSPDTKLKDMQRNYKNQVTGNILPILNSSTKTVITQNCKLSGTTLTKEALLYNLLTKNSFKCNYSIDKNTVLGLKNEGVKIAVSLKEKTPKIFVNIKLEADVVWTTENTDIEKIQTKATKLLTNQITDFMNNCSSKYKADIFNLYKYAKVNYLTIESWENENWQNLFEQAHYSVNINLKIKRKGH